MTLLLGFSLSAYGLLWAKRWGLAAGLASGLIGLAVVVVGSVIRLRAGAVHLPFEPIIQVPFIVSLLRRRRRWNTP